MTLNTENNPCCKKKGTLVITIEPCTKGKETKSDQHFLVGDRYVPGLPHKTPRTMEIEIQIKSRDPKRLSDEELDLGVDENMEEIELKTHSLLEEEEEGEQEEGDKEHYGKDRNSAKDSSEESIKSAETKPEPNVSCSSKTIPLERKSCSKTCPGPLICLQHKEHFLGDKCQLHDPTLIGKQILAMHKNGLIRKRLYITDRIYPEHILSTVSEISKRQAGGSAVGTRNIVSGDKGDVIEVMVPNKSVAPIQSAMVPKKTEEPVGEPKLVTPIPQAPKEEGNKTGIPQAPKEEGNKTGRSGCFC